ncbi:MAG: flavodoxin family protein [Syntrophobacterales bacterium]|jgi:multimeric flavodoxin WrbA|nr:flavodoxin family protein [Syntrophobacterales bacterium]
MIKVIGFNGSPRKDGNTSLLIKEVFGELEKEGIQTELMDLAGKTLHGCIACYKCLENQNHRCAVPDDVNTCIAKMEEAQGIILGSPTYFTDVSAEMKALIDRAGMVAKVNGDMLRLKAGGGVVAVRRAGGIHAFDTLNHFFLIGQMIIPGSSYWNVGIGREKGEVLQDEEGLLTMRNLGKNMALVLKKIHS